MYTILENARIVVALLKEHNIRHIVLSPGGSNIPIVQAVQQDSFFRCYSVVDERSAMYFAIGLHLQTGEIIATSCTSANATRNYIPGLTEAFYKRVPILAITMSKHPMYLLQEYMQCPVQTSLPVDCVKKSYSLPRIFSNQDRVMCIRMANEAILELTHHSVGPVQLNIEVLDNETWSFDSNAFLPRVRTIQRINSISDRNELRGKRIMILIGEQRTLPFETRDAIEMFCKKTNSFVYANHLSNYHGEYAFNANLLLSGMSQEVFDSLLKPDVLISIGGITGDYSVYNKLFLMAEHIDEHWRVSTDGDVIDTYAQLTRVYQLDVKEFFLSWEGNEEEHNYFKCWLSLEKTLNREIDIPFSNIFAAQKLHKVLPRKSIVNFAILNSLRSWLYFPVDSSITCYSNIASFGIDGCLSTFLGESVATNEMCFLIIGDLSFYYDMNAIGIRHIKNNIRILLVNNNGGVEFKLGELQNNTDVSSYIAADGHFKNTKGWAETQGFNYICARNKTEFSQQLEAFISYSEKPVIFELFTDSEDEKKANEILINSNRKLSASEDIKRQMKKTIKKVIGNENAKKLKNILSIK